MNSLPACNLPLQFNMKGIQQVKLKPIRNNIRLALTALSIAVLLGTEALAAEAGVAGNSAVSSTPPVFARVGKVIITQREYDAAFASANRNRFYHGKPPEAEIAVMQREVADQMITGILVLNEAKRRKLKPDNAAVKQKLEQYEQRNAGNQQWQQVRARALPSLTKRFQEEELRSKLEQRVRKVPTPSEKQLRAYYTAHPDKFTEPEQLRVSIILLRVDPSAPDFDTARSKGEDLVKQLRAGADFAEFATLYSSDAETVEQGGDMGYLHGGMLSEMSQLIVSKLKPGEISDPIGLMEGIGIFKLTDRKEAKLNSFDAVKQRARELYLIDEGERAWKTLIAQLRNKTPIQVDESRYLPLPAPAATQATVPNAVEEPGTK